jgi:magnesium transporter
VVDQHWKLLDDLPIRDLLLADPDEKIEDLIDHKLVVLNAFDDQETAVQIFKDYNRVALPVVGQYHYTISVSLRLMIFSMWQRRKTRKTFHKLRCDADAVINPVLATVSFSTRTVRMANGVGVHECFFRICHVTIENVIETVVALVFFLPLLIDSGGNAGSQSATLMIRALAIGDVRRQDWIRLLSKELAVSLLLGITMAGGVSLIATWRAPDIIPVVALTMLATVMVGSMMVYAVALIFTG